MDIMDLIKLKIQLERFTASKLQEAKNYVRQNGIIAWATEEGDGAEDDDRHLVYALVFRQTGTYYRIGRSGVLAPAAWAAYAATVSFMTWTKRIIYIGDFDGDEDDQNFQDTMDEAYGEWATMAVEPYDLEGAQYLDEDTWNEIYEKFTAETDQANWKLEQMRMSHQLKQLNMEYHNITAEDPFAVIQKGHMIFWENNSFIIPDGMMIVTHLQHAFEARVGEQYLLAIPAYTTNEWGISLAIKNLFKAAKVFAVIPKKIVVAYDRHEEYEWSDPWPELWQINETLKDFNNKYTAINTTVHGGNREDQVIKIESIEGIIQAYDVTLSWKRKYENTQVAQRLLQTIVTIAVVRAAGTYMRALINHESYVAAFYKGLNIGAKYGNIKIPK